MRERRRAGESAICTTPPAALIAMIAGMDAFPATASAQSSPASTP
jgi:hypothetical protein